MTVPTLRDTADRLTDAIFFGDPEAVGAGVPIGRIIATGNGLQGGGDLSVNRTHRLGPLTADWTGGAFNVNNKNSISVLNAVYGYGADPTGVADSTAAIQAALDAADAIGPGSTVYLPPGHYKTTGPIYLPFAVRLVGQGRTASYIEKTNNTAGSGTNVFNGATDNYAVDAVIICKHGDNLSNFNPTIQELSIMQTGATNSGWGIWAFRSAKPDFRNLYIDKCDVGIEIRFGYMGHFSQIEITNAVTGIKIGDSGETDAQSTTTTFDFDNCWPHQPVASGTTAYDLYRLNYANFSCCGADGWNPASPGGVYKLNKCHSLTFNGCGAEDFTGPVVVASDSEFSFDAFFTFSAKGVSSGALGYLDLDASFASFTACHWGEATGGNPANWFPIRAVDSSITITASETPIPQGGVGMAAQPSLTGSSITHDGAFGARITAGYVAVSDAAATSRDFIFQTDGTHRWILRGNAATESGSDAGTDFELIARDDTGANIDSPIVCLRAAGGGFTLNRPLANTVGAVLASQATIVLTDQIHHVSGTGTIESISYPAGILAGTFYLIPDGAFTWNTNGNIGKAGTAVVGKTLAMTFDGASWYPSYV